MRNDPGRYRLKFLLPHGVNVVPGQQPADSYCAIEMGYAGNVSITAPSREAAFELATKLLRQIWHENAELQTRPPIAIAAVLESPCADRFNRPYAAKTSWSVIIGADVAFSPTAILPYLPAKATVLNDDSIPALPARVVEV